MKIMIIKFFYSYNMSISLDSTISKSYYFKGLALESLERGKEALQRFYFWNFNFILITFSFQEALNLDPSDEDT